ncbi:putative amidase [Iris pallida]|uniref:Amidase n=1 Tax=Iris pallida TaxID=29817 RepID=A0AAX6FC05_IRIPA|nr:putative amidase [Iris pallida]
MALPSSSFFLLLSSTLLLLALPAVAGGTTSHATFNIDEATIDDIQQSFRRGDLTSRALLEHYLNRTRALNPLLRAVIEVNPDALRQADRADRERRSGDGKRRGGLHGIPVLLKDNIATGDRLNTTAGSFALLGSLVPRDSGVARKLQRAGAVIFGKASMSEWAHYRSWHIPSGWSARGGQGRNPYVLSAGPCDSSSGSAIAVAANMVSVSLGTETAGSIICPSARNSVVGIKPTVGLTSRAGVIPVTPRQDTIGPICRTVSDAVQVLEAIVGFDERDAEATREGSRYIPLGGYRQFLKKDGLKGKRLGVLRKVFLDSYDESIQKTFEEHFDTMRQRGGILIDDLEIANVESIIDPTRSGEFVATAAEFKMSLNAYLSELIESPVRSLLDVILFNDKHSNQERTKEFGQDFFLVAQNRSGLGAAERAAIANMGRLSTEGLERLMKEKQLDAVVTPDAIGSRVLAIGGYPGISVPAGYRRDGVPFGICFGGLKGSEPKLIEMAYAFEQATKLRTPPAFK